MNLQTKNNCITTYQTAGYDNCRAPIDIPSDYLYKNCILVSGEQSNSLNL
jgi:hypothetical protein